MNKLILPLALIGAIVPVALIGCGGGSGLGPAKTRSPQTPQTPQTPQPVALAATTATLDNGQRITLNPIRTGTALSGTVVVSGPTAQTRLQSGVQNLITRTIKVGTFTLVGTFTAPRGYNIRALDGATELFQMNGDFPTQTQDGTYNLRLADGQTESGRLPVAGTTPTPRPTTAPTPGPTTAPTTPPTNPGGPMIRSADGTFDFTIANNAESNFVFTDIKGSGDERAGSSSRVTGGIIPIRAPQRPIAQLTLKAQPIGANQDARPESTTVDPATRDIEITCYKQGNFAVGDRFQTGYNEPSEFDEGFVTVGRHFFPPVTTTPNRFVSWGSERNNTKRLPRGSITITAFTPNSITVALKDVLCAGFSVTGNDTAQGIITVNGTFTVNNYSVF